MQDIAVIITLSLLSAAGVLMTAVRLPGTWLLVAAAVGLGLWTDWKAGIWLVIVLTAAAIIGEVVELLMSVFFARKAGATKQAAWGGLIGGVLGMFFLSFLVPIPLVGTAIGAVAGCFLGAMVVELWIRKKLAQGTKVGVFSAIGFVLGTVTKTALALMMSGVLLTSVVCSKPQAAPVERESPTSDSTASSALQGYVGIEDGPDPAGTRDGPLVLDLQQLRDFAVLDKVRRRRAPLLVDKAFDDLMEGGRSALA